MNRRFILGALLCSCLPLAFAAPGGKKPSPILIVGAEPSLELGQLLISGTNFPDVDASAVEVLLFAPASGGEIDLLVLDYSYPNQETLTELPAELGNTPGTFLLTVTIGNSTDVFDVTIGAVGPEGPQGPPGVSGLTIVEVELEIDNMQSETTRDVRVLCPDSLKVIAGGYVLTPDFSFLDVRPEASYADTESSWLVRVKNLGSNLAFLTAGVQAICVAAE